MTSIAPVSSVSRGSDPALAEAARGFEQIFLRQMIGAMRSGSLGDPLLGSAGEDQFRELFDARMAESMAVNGGGPNAGLGIGALLAAQLEQGQSGMSDLINIGLSATRAYAASLRMVGENIANANDPAYVRRRVLLNEAAMPVRGSPLFKPQISTGGVEIGGVGRAVDPLADAARRRADSARAESGARAGRLGRLETAVGDGEFGIGARMTAFFGAGARAVATPDDPAGRLEMLGNLTRVAEGFVAAARRIDALDGDFGTSMTSAVATLNTDMANLAAINRDLRAARPGSAAQAQLFDRRDAAIGITAAVPASISYDRHGAATLDVGGTVIVAGITAETLTATRAGSGGITLTAAGSAAVPLGGSGFAGLDTAGQAIRARRTDLDAQAAAFVTQINSWNAGGTTPSGASGGALLSGTDALSITATTSDPATIAAATPGGNPAGNLLALEALRGASGAEATWRLSINRSGIETRNARLDAEAAEIFADQAAATRDAVSGVDMDAEAAEMLRLQQAYGAAARVLQVARDTVQAILDIV